MTFPLNDTNSKNNSKVPVASSIFLRRRSSIHLQDAEKDLDLRANTLIGLNKEQIEKFVNFDKEYFKQLSKSPTGKFTNPMITISEVTNKLMGKDRMSVDSREMKQTAYFIDSQTSASDRTTAVELRRAYSNLTKESKNFADKSNIYQHAYKRSKTDVQDIYADRKVNLPPLTKEQSEPFQRKRLKFGTLRSFQNAPPIEQLPPIQLRKVSNSKKDSDENDMQESTCEYQEKAYNETENFGETKTQTLLALRYSNGKGIHGYSGELKLHANQSELDELIEKSKNPMLVANSRPLRRPKTLKDMGFVIASASTADVVKETREAKSNFEIRKEYGKNLEKNWFKSFLQQAKQKKGETASKFDLNLELFYSPEPGAEEGSVVSDVDSKCDENLDNSEDENNKVSEIKTFQKKKHLLDLSGLFSSTDVLTGEDNELDRDTPSEIEFVLTDNELVQKKTKHKMRKQRKRKEKRCKAMPSKNDSDDIVQLPEMSDKELRAMRLNIRKKKAPTVLTGKRKFLQAANAVFVAVQFQKILKNVRDRNRKRRRRKIKKKTRRIKWKEPMNAYADFERVMTPPTLKEKFLQDIGKDLLNDVDKLSFISDGDDTNFDPRNGKPKPLSKFAIEANKACLEDVERLLTDQNRTLRKFNRLRRHSAPLLSMPEGFLIELSEKSKGKRRDRSKSIRRVKSAKKKEKRFKSPDLIPKCSCSHKQRNARGSFVNLTGSQAIGCVHKEETEVRKVRYFVFHRSQVLKRRPSLNEQELKRSKGIDLSELLRDVDIPAKDIRIQIIQRKLRKQKRQKEAALVELNNPPVETEDSDSESESSSELETDESSSDYEYDTKYTTPFVSAGVAWNQPKTKRATWTSADVDRELKRVTRFFLEMKDCSYIRFTGINQAIITKLDEIMS